MYPQKMSINMFSRGVVLSSDDRDGRGCISATIFAFGMGVKFAKVTPLRFPGDQLVLPDTARVPERCSVI